MNVLRLSLSPQPVVEQVGWILIHSLWIGALIAAAGSILVRALRFNSARARYNLLATLFLLIPVSSIGFSLICAELTEHEKLQVAEANDDWNPLRERVAALPASVQQLESVGSGFSKETETTREIVMDGTTSANSMREEASLDSPITIASPVLLPLVRRSGLQLSWLVKMFPWIVGFWLIGVALFGTRMLLGWHTIRRLASVGTSPADDVDCQCADRICDQLGITRAIRFCTSCLVEVPTVIGFWRPVVLLPIMMMNSLSPQEIESILAHELAHIQRRDFLVNLIQTILETLMFYHPAVWWLSSRIRQERENACDDIAVSVVGNRVEYARALTEVAVFAKQHRLMVAANGGDLSSRVRRLLTSQNRQSHTQLPLLSGGFLVAFVVSFCLFLSANDTTVDGQTNSQNDDATAESVKPESVPSVKKFEPIAGIILGPDKKPLAGVTVFLRRRPYNYHKKSFELAQVMTKADGKFEFKDIAIPDFEQTAISRIFPLDVIAKKPGLSIRWKKISNEVTDVRLQLKKESAFKGLVRDDLGRPVANARVVVKSIMSLNTISKIDLGRGSTPSASGHSFLNIEKADNQTKIFATTDANGKFMLSQLPRRVGIILQVDDDRYLKQEWYAATTNEPLPKIRAGKVIPRKKSKDVSDLVRREPLVELVAIHGNHANLKVTRGVRLRVRVVDEGGTLVSGADVAKMWWPGNQKRVLNLTDANGYATVARCPKQENYGIRVTAPESSSFTSVRQMVDLRIDGIDTDREVQLVPGVPVSGSVVDQETQAGVEGAVIQCVMPHHYTEGQRKFAVVDPVATDQDGEFRIVVPKGTASLMVNRIPSGYQRAQQKNISIDTLASERIDDVVLSVKKRPRLLFQFEDKSQNAVSATVDLRIVYNSRSYQPLMVNVDSTGRLDAAKHFNSVQEPRGIRLMIRNREKAISAYHRIKDLSKLQSKQPIKIILRPDASVTGQVTDRVTKLPVTGVRVGMSVSYTPSSGQGVGSYTTDKDGRFKFDELIPGMKYSFGFDRDGYQSLNSIHTHLDAIPGKQHEVGVALKPKMNPNAVIGDLKLHNVVVPSLAGLRPRKALSTLEDSYIDYDRQYRQLLQNESDNERRRRIVQQCEPTRYFADAFEKLANENRDSDIELKALIWMCKSRSTVGAHPDWIKRRAKLAANAVQRILSTYRERKEITPILSTLVYSGGRNSAYDNAISFAKSPHPEIAGVATLLAAQILEQNYKYQVKHDSVRQKAMEHYQEVIDDYNKIPYWNRGTLGTLAAERLFQLKFIREGAEAPEIEGVDLQGKPMKLSEFKGKIVLLHFWGSDYHSFEKLVDLQSEHEDAEIEVLGITAAVDAKSAQAVLDEAGLKVRCWHDPEKKIASKWNQGWPNTKMIDQSGKIVYLGSRESRGRSLEDLVFELMRK